MADPACFSQTTSGCPEDENGTTLPACSVYVSQTQAGRACREACEDPANAISCSAGMASYCQTYSGNADCRCLAPDNTTYGQGVTEVAYNNLQTYVTENGMGSVDEARCFYPACRAGNASILPDTSLDCKAMKIYCAVSGVSVTLQNVHAQNLNVISQKCGPSQRSSKPATGSLRTGDVLQHLLDFNAFVVIAIGVVAVFLVVLFLLWKFSSHQACEVTTEHLRYLQRAVYNG